MLVSTDHQIFFPVLPSGSLKSLLPDFISDLLKSNEQYLHLNWIGKYNY